MTGAWVAKVRLGGTARQSVLAPPEAEEFNPAAGSMFHAALVCHAANRTREGRQFPIDRRSIR
jgi:hypothetical protein